MTPTELDLEDADVPQMAVKALTEAHRRAIREGRTVVVLVKGTLVRMGPAGVTELKKLPPRRKVAVRVKRASS